MTTERSVNPNSSLIKIIASILVSGLCWYFSWGIKENIWFLVWFAPIPILLLLPNENGRKLFLAALLGYLIGKLSWLSYLAGIAAIVPAVIFILLLSLVFAVVVILSRWIFLRVNSWYAIFAFPVFYTVFEYLCISFSPHGTAFAIANTQVNCVPLIQIASITGILGITFIVLLIPSAVSVAWHYRKNSKNLKIISVVLIGLTGTTFLYGFIRSGKQSRTNEVAVGLAVLDEKMHTNSDSPTYAAEKQVAEAYAKQISMLASKGAKLILLPERAIGINEQWADSVKSVLQNAAKQNRVFVIAGNTLVSGKSERNAALVIDSTGNILLDYTKKYLIPGLESQFVPGKKIGLFRFDSLRCGVAICKDMDFPEYLRQYGRHELQVLFVPAWDFGVDDWFHSRMAILRSVENGFSQVRCARRGRLSINDPYGNVTYESNAADGKSAYLAGTVSSDSCRTFYTITGSWFGPLNIIGACVLIVVAFLKNGFNRKSNRRIYA